MPFTILLTREVLRKPAATTNMVAISRVFALLNPARAVLASTHLVMNSAARESIAVSHMGILLSM